MPRGPRTVGTGGALRTTVETRVGRVAATIEASLDAIPASVQALLDAVSTTIRPFLDTIPIVPESLTGEQQQAQSNCIDFLSHDDLPLDESTNLETYNAGRRRRLTSHGHEPVM
jgi:hypothetical protein